MGIWGTGPFDNDHVADALGEFSSRRTASSGLKTIEAMLGDRNDWSYAVGAAELINIVRGHGKYSRADEVLLEEFLGWIDRTDPKVPAALLQKARARMAVIVADAEIRREWRGSDGAKWKKSVDGIYRRLKLS